MSLTQLRIKEGGMSLVVTKNIKSLFRQKGIKTSQLAVDAINKEIEKLCLKAADNVVADKLKIVKAVHVPQIDVWLDSSHGHL